MSPDPFQCPLSPDRLVGAIEVLVSRIDQMLDLHKWITKWLLIAVIVMALGEKGYSMAEKFFHGTTAAAQEQTK